MESSTPENQIFFFNRNSENLDPKKPEGLLPDKTLRSTSVENQEVSFPRSFFQERPEGLLPEQTSLSFLKEEHTIFFHKIPVGIIP